ncbi:MAG: PQQ-binding-like beta-propeller repeat protein [Phycisphaerales bacterium]|nr:PQQ-binding-like beta-propeller repeat protein [Phycisphaerales bacterium]
MSLARCGLILALGLGGVMARGDDAPAEQPPAQGLNPTDFYGKESNQGVYVRDSAVALEKFALGQRMERLKEWNKSADVFQEILEKYPDRVVQSRVDEEGKICQYTSVAMAVRQRLAKWPAEGLAVYKARYEPVAESMLRKAKVDDYAALHNVLSMYFVTDAARAAGLRLVGLYLESGDFAAAARIGDELLTWHPALVVERPELLYRVSLAYHLCGDEAKSARLAEELKNKFPNATGTIAGRDVELNRSLETMLQMGEPVPRAAGNDSWPMFMGSPDRGRVSNAAGRPGARIFSTALHPGKWSGASMEQLRQFQRQEEINRAAGAALGIVPSVDHGQLFFQDGARLYAVNLESGFPLPGWAQTYGGDRDGQYITGGWGVPRGQQLTVTVTDDAVLAVMGQMDRMAVMMGQAQSKDRQPRLVCLDRRTGAQRWVVGANQLPDEVSALRNLSLNGSPLVIGDNVFVAARGGKGAQFEDCYILCFDLGSGKYKWSCYIASANSGNMMWGGEVPLPYETCAQLAYSSGRLYVLTNLGALAAVDAYRGSIAWLSIYPRNVSEDANMRFRRFGGSAVQNFVKPWTLNPLILQDGRLFALPSDAQHVLIYDASTGMEQKRINLADAYNADTLVGVMGSRLVLAGERRVVCLNWPNYDPVRFTSQNESMVHWLSANIVDPLRGRPFMTGDSVFACTTQKLLRFDLKSGMMAQGYPVDGQWDSSEGPGNVIVTSEHVIVAGDRRVNVYTDMQLARAKLDAEVAAAPDQPEPRLRYAEMMFAAGQYQLSLQKLDEAIGLLGGLKAMRAGSARDRVFADALTFARKLARERDGKAQTLSMADALYDRAAAAASTPVQQVQYRLGRARFTHTIRDFTAELSLYQQILDDPQLRRVTVHDDQSASSAGEIAERAIADLIRKNGPKVYAAIEQAAVRALAAARSNNRPADFVEVARRYPNSATAPQALLAAADAYETLGDHRSATQILRQLYFKHPGYPNQFLVLESLARNYLAMPNHLEVAISRLAQADKLPGEPRLTRPLKLPDGTLLNDMTFAEAVDQLRQYAARVGVHQVALPDLRLPARRGKSEPFAAQTPDSIVAPVAMIVPQNPRTFRPDRLVAWSDHSTVNVYESGSARPLIHCTGFDDAPVGADWLGTRPLVYGDHLIALIDPAGGSIAWKVDLQSLAAPADAVTDEGEPEQPGDEGAVADPNILQIQDDQRIVIQGNRQVILRNGRVLPLAPQPRQMNPDAPEQFVDVLVTTDRIVAATSAGRVLAIDAADGSICWQARLVDQGTADRLLVSEDFTVVRVTNGSTIQLVVLDTFGGQILHRWSFSAAAGQSPLNMALSADGVLVYTLPDRLRGKDLYEPAFNAGQGFTWEVRPANPARRGGEQLFIELDQPDQLLISQGRVIALSDMGRFVRIYSLDDGKPLIPPGSDAAEVPLSTGFDPGSDRRNVASVSLHPAGPMLYIAGPQSLQAYNLDRPGEKWTGLLPAPANIRDILIARQELLLISDPSVAANVNKPANILQLLVYSRQPTSSGESGKLVFDPILNSPSSIISWQPADGGLYYLTADQKLHFLKGAGTN